MHGLADRLFPIEKARCLAENLSQAQLYAFQRRGHLPVFTAVREFCDVLRCFVRTGDVPEPGGSEKDWMKDSK